MEYFGVGGVRMEEVEEGGYVCGLGRVFRD